MHLSMFIVIHWIEDLAQIGDCLEEQDGIPCRQCWEDLTHLVIVIATALDDGTI